MAPQQSGTYVFTLASALATVLDNLPPPIPPAHWPVSAATVYLNTASFSFDVRADCAGDMNCDGQVDFGDINPFVQYIASCAGWQATYPEYPPENGDIDRDGLHACNGYPFDDVSAFPALLNSAPLPIPCD